MSAPRLRPLEAIAWTLVTAALLVAGWHVAVRTSGTLLFPSPAAVARALGELGRRGVLAGHVAGSLGRVLAGYGLAVLVGVPVGMLMGVSRTVAAALNPLVQLGRPISPLAWTPVVIVLVGIGERAAIVLVFLGALFPLIVAAADGFHGVARVYVRSGHNFGLSTAQLIWRVALPASLPNWIP